MPAVHLNIPAGGPLILTVIGVSVPRLHALQTAGITAPTAGVGTFLIDTGASCTCVDTQLISNLGLQPTGRVAISTPSTGGGSHFCDQFDISLFIQGVNGSPGHLVSALPVVATHLKAQGIDGLIGRDVLKNCTFIYNGTAAFATLAY